MREINTGRGPVFTDRSPDEIAEQRAKRLDSYTDRVLFVDTFQRVRQVAVDLANTLPGAELLYRMCAPYPVMEAAYIEALASLRAEGVRI